MLAACYEIRQKSSRRKLVTLVAGSELKVAQLSASHNQYGLATYDSGVGKAGRTCPAFAFFEVRVETAALGRRKNKLNPAVDRCLGLLPFSSPSPHTPPAPPSSDQSAADSKPPDW